MKIALAAVAVLLLSACAAAPRASDAPGLFSALSEVSDVKAGQPLLVFVYTDG